MTTISVSAFRRITLLAPVIALAASLSSCMGFAYGVRTDDPAVSLPCKYGAECKKGASTQFTSGLWRQRRDSVAGTHMAWLWIDHLQRPYELPGLGMTSTLEFESYDRSVTLDVSSVRIVHRSADGRVLQPLGIHVDTTIACTSCETQSVGIAVRQIYGSQRLPRHVSEEIAADLIVRGVRVPVRVVFRDVRYRLQWTFWDVMMGV